MNRYNDLYILVPKRFKSGLNDHIDTMKRILTKNLKHFQEIEGVKIRDIKDNVALIEGTCAIAAELISIGGIEKYDKLVQSIQILTQDIKRLQINIYSYVEKRFGEMDWKNMAYYCFVLVLTRVMIEGKKL
jgi:hypothetical protein